MNWRPDNWDAEDIYAAQSGLAGSTEMIEAGADAMLEALKAQGVEAGHVRSASYEFIALGGGNASYKLSEKTPNNTDGWLVFIPEEEQKLSV